MTSSAIKSTRFDAAADVELKPLMPSGQATAASSPRTVRNPTAPPACQPLAAPVMGGSYKGYRGTQGFPRAPLTGM